MYSILATSLALLAVAGRAHGYVYGGDEFITGSIVVRCIYSVASLALAGLCVIPLAVARAHGTPYVLVFFALLFTAISLLASIALLYIEWDIDALIDNIPYKAAVAMDGINSLFSSWSLAFAFLAFAHLIKVRSDNVTRSLGHHSAGLNSIWTVAYFTMFALLLIFGTAGPAAYINLTSSNESISEQEFDHKLKAINSVSYTFSAIWYCTAFLIGSLAYTAYKSARKAGVNDKILRTILFVVFPLHVVNLIEDLVFTILLSPAGLKTTLDNVPREQATLAEAIVAIGLHLATMGVLVFLGLRRSNWTVGNSVTAAWQEGRFIGYPSYPLQVSYQIQDPSQVNLQK